MLASSLPLSKHGEQRKQQRAVPTLHLDLLLTYGTRTRAMDGADVVYFDGRARKALKQDAGSTMMARLSDLIGDVYAIVSDDGTVITVAPRLRRIRRCLRRQRGGERR